MSQTCSKCHDYIEDEIDTLYECESCKEYLCVCCIPGWDDAKARIRVCTKCKKYSECKCEDDDNNENDTELEKVLCKDCSHPTPPEKDVIKFLLSKAGYDSIEAVHEEYCSTKNIVLYKHTLRVNDDDEVEVVKEEIKPKPLQILKLNKRKSYTSVSSVLLSPDINDNTRTKKQCL
jgi:hypothetical protein